MITMDNNKVRLLSPLWREKENDIFLACWRNERGHIVGKAPAMIESSIRGPQGEIFSEEDFGKFIQVRFWMKSEDHKPLISLWINDKQIKLNMPEWERAALKAAALKILKIEG